MGKKRGAGAYKRRLPFGVVVSSHPLAFELRWQKGRSASALLMLRVAYVYVRGIITWWFKPRQQGSRQKDPSLDFQGHVQKKIIVTIIIKMQRNVPAIRDLVGIAGRPRIRQTAGRGRTGCTPESHKRVASAQLVAYDVGGNPWRRRAKPCGDALWNRCCGMPRINAKQSCFFGMPKKNKSIDLPQHIYILSDICVPFFFFVAFVVCQDVVEEVLGWMVG